MGQSIYKFTKLPNTPPNYIPSPEFFQTIAYIPKKYMKYIDISEINEKKGIYFVKSALYNLGGVYKIEKNEENEEEEDDN